jgi:hypothetical protein
MKNLKFAVSVLAVIFVLGALSAASVIITLRQIQSPGSSTPGFIFGTLPSGVNSFLQVGSGLTINSAGQLSVTGISPTFTDAETPSGTVNGTNATFTLAAAPGTPASLILTVNGVVQIQGSSGNYTLSGTTITFLSGSIPQPGDVLMDWHR